MTAHGTYGGYQAHRKAGEQACAACLAGYAEYMQQYRDAVRITSPTYRALRRLRDRHRKEFAVLLEQEKERGQHPSSGGAT